MPAAKRPARTSRASAPPAPSAPSTSSDPVISAAEPKIRRRIQDMLAEHHLPGCSIGIVRDQRLVWSEGFGYADLDTQRRPDEHTVYRVASISKTFTSLAVVQLRDRGLLALDDPLVKHIPEFSKVRVLEGHRGKVENVTLRRLLSHRSGLISEGPFSYWDTMRFPTMDQIIRALPKTEVVLAPDAGAKYSNLAFALLGEVVTRVSGEDFPKYVARHIFRPPGMRESSFEPSKTILSKMATGYLPHPFEDRPEPAGHSPTNGIAAAAGLYTTVADLAKWISLQLTAAPAAIGLGSSPVDDEAEPDPKAVLRPRSLDEMHTPQAIDPDWTEARCIGWFGRRRAETVVIGHGGSIHGFITNLIFHKPTKTGVILLTNEGRHQAAAPAALDVMDLVLAELKAQPTTTIAAPPSPTPPELRRFLGRYQLWMGSIVHVEFRNGALQLIPGPPEKLALHAPAKLAPTPDPLVYRVTQGRAAGELLRFETKRLRGKPAAEASEAPVTGFTLSGFKYTKVG